MTHSYDTVGGRSSRRCKLWSTLKLDLGNWRLLSCLPFHSQKLPQTYSLEIMIRRWDQLDDTHDWTQLRSQYKLWFGGQLLRSYFMPKTEVSSFLIYKFPCLLSLPPTNLEWPASFFGLPLASPYGDQFQIMPLKLPRLQTNKCYLRWRILGVFGAKDYWCEFY